MRSSLTLRELARVGARDQVGEETHYKDTGWRVALRGFGDGRERELTGAALVAAARVDCCASNTASERALARSATSSASCGLSRRASARCRAPTP